MKLSLEELKGLFSKSTVRNKNLRVICPKCGEEECYVSIDLENHPGRCWRERNCGYTFNIISLLILLDRLSEFSSEYKSYSESVENKINREEFQYQLYPKEITLPLGFKLISKSAYLDQRKFTKGDYERHLPGITNYPSFNRNRIFFPTFEDFKVVGYVSRSVYSKEHCLENEILRYTKSEESDFSKILHGFNYQNSCKTVVLVEGYFDYFQVLRTIEKYKLDMICIPLFGVELSIEQSLKLKLYGVETLIYLLDKDIEHRLRTSSPDNLYMFDTYVSFCNEKDPDESSLEEIFLALQNKQELFNFLLDTVTIRTFEND